jgi:hypothetical protein
VTLRPPGHGELAQVRHRAITAAPTAGASPSRHSFDPHTCCVHTPPGFVQTPHEELQQTSPTAHVLSPHFTGGGGLQTCFTWQLSPGFLQIPHAASQQT